MAMLGHLFNCSGLFRVDALISWAANRFSTALFCSYEQVYPDDGFGKVM